MLLGVVSLRPPPQHVCLCGVSLLLLLRCENCCSCRITDSPTIRSLEECGVLAIQGVEQCVVRTCLYHKAYSLTQRLSKPPHEQAAGGLS